MTFLTLQFHLSCSLNKWCVECNYLHGDQIIVESLFSHQLTVSPQLFDFTILNASNDISISDC